MSNETVSLKDFDEAAAFELSLVSRVPYDSHAICDWFRENLRKNLAARSAQLPAEPAAWQERQARRMKDGVVTEWSNWYDCRPRSLSEPRATIDADNRIPYEWRPLYTSPAGAPLAAAPEDARDAARFRMLLNGPTSLGVFICDMDGIPNDSLNNSELLKLLDDEIKAASTPATPGAGA